MREFGTKAPVYDLTRTVMMGMPCYPGDPEVRIEPLPGFAPWQVSAIAMGTHSGTHVDAPRHRIPGGADIGSYGPERLIGTGVVIDTGELADNQPIPVSILDAVRDVVAPGWFAVFRTGWERFWGEERYFRHPHLSRELAKRLVRMRAGIVAIDALSVDSTVDAGADAHIALLGTDTLIAENLRNLDLLEANHPYTFAFLPLLLDAADGAPARVVAWKSGAPPR
jgi:kynurenine formamidase